MPSQLSKEQRQQIEKLIEHFSRYKETFVLKMYDTEMISKIISNYLSSKAIDPQYHYDVTNIALQNMPKQDADSFLTKLDEEVARITNRPITKYLLYFPINVKRPDDRKHHEICLGDRRVLWIDKREFDSIINRAREQGTYGQIIYHLEQLNWGQSNREHWDYSCLKIEEKSLLSAYAVQRTYKVANIVIGLVNLSMHALSLQVIPSMGAPHSKLIPPAGCLCTTENGDIVDFYYYQMFPNDGERMDERHLKNFEFLRQLYVALPDFKKGLFEDALILFNYGVSELNTVNALLAFYRGFEIMTMRNVEDSHSGLVNSIAGFFIDLPYLKDWFDMIRKKRHIIVHGVGEANIVGSEINLVKYLYSKMLLYIIQNKDLDTREKLKMFFEYCRLPSDKLETIQDVIAKLLKQARKEA